MEKDKQPNRRQLLMLTAQTLFARRGIDAVSLNEINKAAGQRNTSALHYHFGNKEGLISAIIYEHYAAIDRQTNLLLDHYEQLPAAQQTSRKLWQAVVTPFSEQLDSSVGVSYLLIVSQVFMKSTELIFGGHPSGEDRARLRIFGLFEKSYGDIPAPLRASKTLLCASLLFNSLATYAQLMQEPDSNPLGHKALFISNLVDSLNAMMAMPPSAETLAMLE